MEIEVLRALSQHQHLAALFEDRTAVTVLPNAEGAHSTPAS